MDRVIAPSHYIKEEAVRNGIAPDKVEIIPLFTEKNLEEEWVEPEENSILFVGRPDPLKGVCELIKALYFIRDLRWKAYIIGVGEKLLEFKKMASELGIEKHIVFISNLGYAELDNYYKRASIVVFPSISPESFGLVGIEAMSFGRPVVAFDTGGPREWLVDGETGFIARRGDVEGLALSISRLLKDKIMVRRMGKTGMSRVDKYYRKEAHLDRMIKLYEKVIEGRDSVL